MKTVRLARLAMEAEALRWRRLGSRFAVRAILAAIALFFAAGAVVFAHIAGWVWLTRPPGQPQLSAAGILAGVDLMFALLFAFLASRSTPSRGELEALELRREAIRGMGSTLNLVLLAGTALRWINGMRGGRET